MSNRKLDPVQKLLLDAAALVRERGLAKGTQLDDKGRVCLMGALSIAAYGEPYMNRDDAIVQAAVQRTKCYLLVAGVDVVEMYPGSIKKIAHEHYLRSSAGLGGWNNAEGRTVDEVVAALEGAARMPVAA